MDIRNPIDPALDVAVRVSDVTFKWASVAESEETVSEKPKNGDSKGNHAKNLAAKISEETLVEPFCLPDLNMEIPRGRLVAIVGPVGSGKSSLLQGVSRETIFIVLR
jgi:ATP-binding cassette subfamily C (CFTR/MRP) protein 1